MHDRKIEGYPFTSKFMNINGFKYHYIDEGDERSKSVVLMIHGNPTWSFYFRHLIKKLSLNHRAIAVDHIGCGLSEKPCAKDYDYTLKRRIEDLDTFFMKLNIKEKINLILHDWGGMIGIGFALKHIEQIESITVSNTAGFLKPESVKVPLRLLFLKKNTFLSYVLITYFNAFVRAAIVMAPSKKLSDEAKKGLLLPYDSVKNRTAVFKFVFDIPLSKEDKSYNVALNIDKNLNKLSGVKMLICWGKQDFVFNVGYLDEWQKRFPSAKVHIFEKAGHYLFEDEKEKTIAIINDFLKKG